jgi:hypothetical protein
MPLISTRTANVNLPNKSVKLYIFVVPRSASVVNGLKEIMLFAAAKARTYGVTAQGRVSIEPAISGQSIDTHGSISTQDFDVPDGTILKVFYMYRQNLMRSIGSVSTPTTRTAARLYLVRQGAAVITDSFQLIDDSRCTHNRGFLTGPVEEITLEQAEQAQIAPVPRQLRATFTQTEWFEHKLTRRVIQTATSRAIMMPAATQIEARPAPSVVEGVLVHGSARPSANTSANTAPAPEPPPRDPQQPEPIRIVSLPVRRRFLS